MQYISNEIIHWRIYRNVYIRRNCADPHYFNILPGLEVLSISFKLRQKGVFHIIQKGQIKETIRFAIYTQHFKSIIGFCSIGIEKSSFNRIFAIYNFHIIMLLMQI